MLEFLRGVATTPGGASIGTIAWLAEMYTRDEESPYQTKRAVTKEGYDKSLKILKETVGARRIDAITSNDVRRWHKEWGRCDDEGKLANPRRAYGCVQMLRIIVKYGKGLRNSACKDLAGILTDTEFSPGKGRKQTISVDQVKAFIIEAHAAALPSMARAVAIQFACALRQKDVIGEWLRKPDGKHWTVGLRWGEHIKADWHLEKPTSKSNFDEVAEFDLRLLPMVMAELVTVPITSRIGPVILDERSGRPYIQREFARRFRKIAQAARIPDKVWNMDTRAGAISDAYDKEAKSEDAMELGTHKQLATNLKYKRGRIAATNRISKLRFGDKNEG
ncbi:MAG: integrase [Methylocella sp.]